MNPARKSLQPRCLRLERLENRALLAGGALDFTAHIFSSDLEHGDRPERDRDTPRQFDQGERPGRDQHDRHQHDRHQRRDKQRSNERDVAEMSSSAPILSPPSVAQSLPTPTINIEPPVLLRSAAAQVQSPPETVETESSVKANVQSLDLALASLAITDLPDTEETLAGETELVASFDRPKAIESLDEVHSETNSPAASVIADPHPLEGMIELLPLPSWKPLGDIAEPPRDDPALEPWQLDAFTLPRLREAIETTTDELANRTNAVAKDWWSGMVAIDRFQLTPGQFAPTDAFVKVQLESTVMLYRSLDLFASVDATANEMTLATADPTDGPLSDRALDSIMAALGTLAQSQTQPVGNSNPFKLDAIVYPLAAIAVSGAAISAKRRSKQPLLFHSRQRTCNEPSS